MSTTEFETISFRVRLDDYREFDRVSKVLYKSGKIKQPKPSVLAKTFLYVMTNQFKQIEEQAKVIVDNVSTLGGPNGV